MNLLKRENYIRGDALGTCKWEGEVEAFDDVLSSSGDYFSWI
jgi:hypothetical protein